MKKLLFVLLMFCCTSCTNKVSIEESQSLPFGIVIHFEYKGHKYIVFDKLDRINSAGRGIVHDPDCECNQN